MKNLILTLLLVILSSTLLTANEQDTLWRRYTTSGIKDLDFTPDDKYIIAWTNSIEFWNVETATMDFIEPNIIAGGFSSDREHLVFIQDGVPKLLDWQTKEKIEGFEPISFEPNRIRVAHDNNLFMCGNDDSIVVWNIETKNIMSVFTIETDFIEKGDEFIRRISDYSFAGNDDDLLMINIYEENKLPFNHPEKVVRRASLFYSRDDFSLYDSLGWIGGFRFMNTNKNIIAIDRFDGTIEFYNIREKSIINNIKFDTLELSTDDFEFSNDNLILGITRGNSCCRYLKLFRLSDNKLIFEFNDNYSSWDQFNISNNQQKFVASTGSSLYMYSNQWAFTDVEDDNTENILNIYPNPSSKLLQISYEFPQISSYSYSLYNISGKLISIIDDGYLTNLNYSKEYNISYLNSGTYFIKLEYGVHSISKQFIKE